MHPSCLQQCLYHRQEVVHCSIYACIDMCLYRQTELICAYFHVASQILQHLSWLQVISSSLFLVHLAKLMKLDTLPPFFYYELLGNVNSVIHVQYFYMWNHICYLENAIIFSYKNRFIWDVTWHVVWHLHTSLHDRRYILKQRNA